MTDRLPRLRRPTRRISLTRIAGRLLPGVAAVHATVEPFARFWDDHNQDALEADGPLWVALGDSVTQGVGASHPVASYAMRTLDQLRRDTGTPWRLINLSMTGARFTDVTELQLPVIDRFGLAPDLVSAVIGSNDVMWRRNTRAIVADAEAMVDRLPHGAVLSTVSGGDRDERRRAVNSAFVGAAHDGAIRLFDAWRWPASHDLWAQDRFHPNDRAHTFLHANMVEAFQGFGLVSPAAGPGNERGRPEAGH